MSYHTVTCIISLHILVVIHNIYHTSPYKLMAYETNSRIAYCLESMLTIFQHGCGEELAWNMTSLCVEIFCYCLVHIYNINSNKFWQQTSLKISYRLQSRTKYVSYGCRKALVVWYSFPYYYSYFDIHTWILARQRKGN